jgi:hypothetical protein
MSAREDLIDALWRGGDESARNLVDAYAHELAEEVRAVRPEVLEGFTLAESYRLGWDDGRRDAADLIDPEVSDD